MTQPAAIYTTDGILNPKGIDSKNISNPHRLFQDQLIAEKPKSFIQNQIDVVKQAEKADMKATLQNGNELAHVVHVNAMAQHIEETNAIVARAKEAFSETMKMPI